MIFSGDREARLFKALRRAEATRRARREAGEVITADEAVEPARPLEAEVLDADEVLELRRKVAEAIPPAANEPITPRLRRRRRSRGLRRLAAALAVLAGVTALTAWQLYPSEREPSRPGSHLKLEKRLSDPRP